jgi:RNAse (barnase) inhibitor barstar
MSEMRIDLAAFLRTATSPWIAVLDAHHYATLTRVVSALTGVRALTIDGDRCRTQNGVMAEFARALEFPAYFGHNWDAFEECLRDLEWLRASAYAIVVREAENLLIESGDDYRTFVEIMNHAGAHWGQGARPTPHADEQLARGSSPSPVAFHVILVVSPDRLARRDWLVPHLAPTRDG